ncbi:hypothetical protein DFH27DRAFT_21566 [Peziza echinospora]|nr:hypothetical protein DFH27DRAFT_21566 [Peziza echinospora]
MQTNPLFLLSLLLSITSLASAHLTIRNPKPIQFDARGGADKYAAPLKSDGSDFPCKGVLKVGTNEGIGPSVASWRAGELAEFELHNQGVAAHWGGSCQASISYDFGKTFQVLRSFVGGCPRGAYENKIPAGSDQKFQFRIPIDAPGGTAIFGWTYFTVTGFREMYMNCAHITILQDDRAVTQKRLDDKVYPPMFVGEINKCKSYEWFNLEFPRLGPSPHIARDTPFQPRKPGGEC